MRAHILVLASLTAALAPSLPALAQSQPRPVCRLIGEDAPGKTARTFLLRDAQGALSVSSEHNLALTDKSPAPFFSAFGTNRVAVKYGAVISSTQPHVKTLMLSGFTATLVPERPRALPQRSLRLSVLAGDRKAGPYALFAYAYDAGRYTALVYREPSEAEVSPLAAADAQTLDAAFQKGTPVIVTVLHDGKEVGRGTFATSSVAAAKRDALAWARANAASWLASEKCAEARFAMP